MDPFYVWEIHGNCIRWYGMASDNQHSSDPTTGRNDSPLGCLHLILAYRYPIWALLLKWVNFDQSIDKQVIMCSLQCGMKLIIYFQNSTVAQLKYEIDQYIHYTLYNECNYMFVLELKLIHVSERAPICMYGETFFTLAPMYYSCSTLRSTCAQCMLFRNFL